MFDVALAFPFSLGLVAAFNPCGFAMLPAYLSYFLGLEDDSADTSLARNLSRGIVVGLVLTAGFIAVFGLFGLLTSHLLTSGVIERNIPYVTVVVGVAMIPLGVAMLFGYEPTLSLPKLNKGTGSRQLSSVFLFGVSYGVVSISCTAPLFLSAVVGSFTREGTAAGTATFVAYALGMGAVIVFLTMSLALARGSVARRMRSFLPYVNRVSGGLLIVAGMYLVSYGWWEIRILDDPSGVRQNRFQKGVEDFQNDLLEWIQTTGPTTIGLWIGVLVTAAVGYVLYRRRRTT